MAKAKQTDAPQGATPAADPYPIMWGGPPPAPKRGITGEQSDMTKRIIAMPAPAEGKIPSFFVPVLEKEIPENITDPKQRAEVLNDNVRKLTNKLSGATRRVMKQDATKNFTVRATTFNGVRGVGVWRIAVVPPAPAAA
jgi:hypothetical protein